MASKYIQKFPVPEGFSEILHDFTKEILRNQPEDIIEFSAYYFKCVQEGIVLDYPKKGQNIPCDYEASIPKINKKTDIEQHQENDQRLDYSENEKSPEVGINTSQREPENKEERLSDSHSHSDVDHQELRNISSSYVDNVLRKSQ